MADVLVVVAHPDDEVLGCGATLARLTSAGHRVRVLMAADGERGRPGATDDMVAARQDCARRAAQVMDTEPPEFLDLPDQALETVPRIELTRRIESMAARFPPDLVLTHDPGDLNLDHRVVHEATATAFRPLPETSWAALCTFETPSASEYGTDTTGRPFSPTLFVDVVDHLETKLAALGCYPGEQRAVPHPRHPDTVRAQAHVRGAAVGLAAAEAFHVAYLRGSVPLLT